MSTPLNKLQFSRDGFFYDMVTSYMAAVFGLLTYRKANFDPSDKVGLASTEYPALEIRAQEVLAVIGTGETALQVVTDSLANMLINSAYEAVKSHHASRWGSMRRKYPEVEFLRHLRNAASHGGKFLFTGKQPNLPAKWRGHEITRSLQGRPVWEAGIKPGDLFLLLWDIEQRLT